ncbi:MAG: CbiX/SirB N-terminal domain-containing protein [gamma proteobacterium symbiont of Bathyaustriella thionipta]|nr:CbiX/SirB N-terminal domain-containing protein [gamma proteobacterium symbiont of Bathyaustriella thionipta]
MIKPARALLLVAHGSRRASSNEEVRCLTTRLQQAGGHQFDYYASAFLELEAPDIPDGLTQLIAEGVQSIVVVPYFLAAGRHVVEDIPAEVERVQKKYPHIDIQLLPHLGAAEGISSLILNIAQNT